MRFWKFIVNRWARLEPAVVVSVTTIIFVSLVLLTSLLTLKDNYSIFGPGLGADYPQFYCAGQLIRAGQADRLYDLQLQQEYYHQILPNEGETSYLPYVYPPFFSVPFILLSQTSYHISFLLWALILVGLYLAGVLLVCSTMGPLNRKIKLRILLLAAAFPPFIMESVLSGQTPPFGFFAFSLAFALQHHGKPVSAGMALSLCTYKPTLLVLILPLVFIGRQWKLIQGFIYGCFALAAISVCVVGFEPFLNYLEFLFSYVKLTKEGFRTYKYVDIASFVRLLSGTTSKTPSYVGFSGILLAITLLGRLWFQLPERDDARFSKLLWSHTILWTLVMNVYVGMYEVVIAVVALICLSEEHGLLDANRNQSTEKDAQTFQFRSQLLTLFTVCWISQFVALLIHIQLLTIVLTWIGITQFSHLTHKSNDSLSSIHNADEPTAECPLT